MNDIFLTQLLKDFFACTFLIRLYTCEMKWTIIGLGNPGEEYNETPHNVGREAVMLFVKKNFDTDWSVQSKAQAHVATGKLKSHGVTCVLPDTFMNKSGVSGAYFAKTKKDIEQCVVIHDDLDLPLGVIKIVFGRGSGGHKGVESLMRAWKTQDFVRIRIGISPSNAKGQAKKPQGEEKVISYILKPMKKDTYADMKKIYARVSDALVCLVTESRAVAMTQFNG
jgi:PTH1 family peptidyl-tRNA hydrolase